MKTRFTLVATVAIALASGGACAGSTPSPAPASGRAKVYIGGDFGLVALPAVR